MMPIEYKFLTVCIKEVSGNDVELSRKNDETDEEKSKCLLGVKNGKSL